MSKPALLFVALITLVVWCRRTQAADPTVAECLTANETSFDCANDQRLRDERAQLLICAAPSCPQEVQNECLRRANEVSLAIPTIVFELRDAGTGANVSATRVWMDDELLSEWLNGGAVAVDPGEHRFTFESRGRAPLRVRLLIRESEKARRVLITWPNAGNPVGLRAYTAPRRRLDTQRISAIASGAVGVVGAGVGTVFGLETLTKRQSAREVCPSQTCPTQAGVDRWNDAKTAGNIATAAFIVAGVGFASAALLWFTDSSERSDVQVGLGPGGVHLKGAW